MYRDGFVVAVRVGDRFAEERGDGNFVVPFSSEYSIRIKNRNNRKAVARVYIDGEEVNKMGSFILDANGVLDLERFVSDLAKGNKFRFVPLNNTKVKDKNNGENGAIEVRFQLVKPVELPIIYHNYTTHYVNDIRPYFWNNVSYTVSSTPTRGSSCAPATSDCSQVFNCSSSEKGATVEGSSSGQKFSYSYVGELDPKETAIRVQLIGTNDSGVAEYFKKQHCTHCGKKFGENDKYCSGCGEPR